MKDHKPRNNCQFNKPLYRDLCRKEESISIFSRDWWLDAVCGKDKWDVLIAEEKGRIIATLPIYKPLSHIITMPPCTQTMGLWFTVEPGDMKYTTRLGKRQNICKSFINHIDNTSFFLQNFNHDITDWLPFYWKGYKQTTRYTYLLEDIRDPGLLWNNMSSNIRRNIIKAKDKNKIIIKKGIPINDFLTIHRKTFERQQLSYPYQKNLTSLIQTCREREQGEIWGGYDNEGRLHAAVFIVWQSNCAWYLAGGGNPALRDSGAHALALWECIKDVASFSKSFDFEGSMIPGVERFFREFGAKQMPFFTITKGKLSLLDRIRMKF